MRARGTRVPARGEPRFTRLADTGKQTQKAMGGLRGSVPVGCRKPDRSRPDAAGEVLLVEWRRDIARYEQLRMLVQSRCSRTGTRRIPPTHAAPQIQVLVDGQARNRRVVQSRCSILSRQQGCLGRLILIVGTYVGVPTLPLARTHTRLMPTNDQGAPSSRLPSVTMGGKYVDHVAGSTQLGDGIHEHAGTGALGEARIGVGYGEFPKSAARCGRYCTSISPPRLCTWPRLATNCSPQLGRYTFC